MNLTLISHVSKPFCNEKRVENFIEFLFDKLKIDKNRELNVLFCGDDEIRKLNSDFKNRDVPTNVLSFYGYDGDIMGDIAISLDTVEKEAKTKGEDIFFYLLFIVAHGFLHLLGYTHETMDKFNDMMDLQRRLVEEFFNREKSDEKVTS